MSLTYRKQPTLQAVNKITDSDLTVVTVEPKKQVGSTMSLEASISKPFDLGFVSSRITGLSHQP
jgi:hypothetical protein